MHEDIVLASVPDPVAPDASALADIEAETWEQLTIDSTAQEQRRQLALEVEAIALAKAGQPEGFETIYRLHKDAIQRRLTHLAKGDHYLAEDLTQEVFVKAMRFIDGYNTAESSMLPWLMTIARNKFLDHARRGQTIKFESLDNELVPQRVTQQVAAMAIQASTEDATISRLDLAPHLNTILPKLPKEFLTTFIAMDIQGMSQEEAAEALGVKIGTIKSRLFRARKLLRETPPPAGY